MTCKKLYLFQPLPIGTISPFIYGHFTEHLGGVFYDGLWVGEESPIPNVHGFRKALVDAFKLLHPSVLRWPGGCFAECYDWRDGIGPREQRPARVSWWYKHDGRMEPNQVGTHEFVDFCCLVGAEPYIAANITTTTPLDIRDWVDYCNAPRGSTAYARLREANGAPEPFNVKFWGVGNECWGGGGDMEPETYAHEYRKYAMVLSNSLPGLKLIGCGPYGTRRWHWTERFLRVFESSARQMDGLSVHYYCDRSSGCLDFNADQFYDMLFQAAHMEEVVTRAWNLVCGFGCQKECPLVVDEWGAWHPDGSGPTKGYNLYEQQSTMRDALVAAITLNIFNNHCDKVKMANVAQLANNLQTLFLAHGSDFIVTPTYHVFDMFKEHQGATALQTAFDREEIAFEHQETHKEAKIAKLSVSASVKGGALLLTVANCSLGQPAELELAPVGMALKGDAELTLLTHEDPHACNTFEAPKTIAPQCTEGRADVLSVPPASILSARIRLA